MLFKLRNWMHHWRYRHDIYYLLAYNYNWESALSENWRRDMIKSLHCPDYHAMIAPYLPKATPWNAFLGRLK